MSFKMLNCVLADEIMQKINIGDNIDFYLYDSVINEKVISKTAYSLTVKHKTNRLIVPIGLTVAYIEEEKMRIPADNAPTPAKRGRKPKDVAASGPVAPVEHPTQQATRPAWAPPVETAKPAATAPVAAQPGDTEAGSLEWFTQQLDAALAQLREDALTMADALIQDASANLPEYVIPSPAPVKFTCMDCRHSNLTDGSCNRFSMVPPMKVIADAKEFCDAFSLEEIPF